MNLDHRPTNNAAKADPIVAIATAPGRGAIGVIRISGRGLERLARALCGRIPAPRVASYGSFLDADGTPLDHGLAIHFPAPHSYTGEDVLELQAHGGPVVLQMLLRRCLQAAREPGPGGGALLPRLRLARPGEFTERAFLNGKMDLAQAEAVMDLIDASTETAARSATRSLSGVFSQKVNALLEGLVQLRMLVEATLDFPEEEVDVLSTHNVRGRLEGLEDGVEAVRREARRGALLREGIKVVIAGQPNVGKSSLLNALAGASLAIVTDIAGTTRDVVQQTIQMEGVPLHVLDTAGLRESADEVERIGVERAWEHVETADVVLWVRDLTRVDDSRYMGRDEAIRHVLPAGTPALELWNKRDVAPGVHLPGSGIMLSTHTGAGMETLRRRLLELAGWQGGSGEGLFVARERHLQALARTASHLQSAAQLLATERPDLVLLAEELRLAQSALGAITGAFSADDLLGEIFSRFCIGK